MPYPQVNGVIMAVSGVRKALPYVGAALAGLGVGTAGGAYAGSKQGKKKGRNIGRREGAVAALKHFRGVSSARNRALQVFAVRNQNLMRQNQSLRARIGEMASERKRA